MQSIEVVGCMTEFWEGNSNSERDYVHVKQFLNWFKAGVDIL